jgi:hypothetical protein
MAKKDAKEAPADVFIRDPTKAVPGVFRRTFSIGWRPNVVLPKDVMVHGLFLLCVFVMLMRN